MAETLTPSEKARATREAKRAAAEAERTAKLAQEAKRVLEERKALAQVESGQDCLRMSFENPSDRLLHSLGTLLRDAENARERYERELERLEGRLADRRRDLETGMLDSTSAVHCGAADLDFAYGRFYAARRAAAVALDAAGFYCPALESRYIRDEMALSRSLEVVFRPGQDALDDPSGWIVRLADGSVPEAIAVNGNPDGWFPTEEAAWLAVRSLLRLGSAF